MILRTLIVWGIGLPITLVLFFVVMLSLLMRGGGNAVHSIGAFWCRIILKLSGVRVTVKGMNNLPKEGPVIMLSNHQGAFDIPVLQAYIPMQFRWVAKKSLFRIPVVGWSMRFAGYIGIERENVGEALKSLDNAAGKIKSGTSVIIFPEGTRSETGRLLPFKKGAFMLAAKSGVPVVPVAVSGTKDIMKKGGYSITPAEVTVAIGRPFSAEGVGLTELRTMTKEAITELIA